MTATLTRQEVFTKVVQHLRAQNRQALASSGSGRCVYRATNSDKCAAGCLIADEHYSARLEGACANHILVRGALERSGVSSCDIDLVRILQDMHDAYEPDRWEDAFQRIAERTGLELPPQMTATPTDVL